MTASPSKPRLGRYPHRRDVFRGAVALGLGAWVGTEGLSSMARAMDGASDRYLLICDLRGGWDVLASVDPRDPSVFTPERRRDTLIDATYDKYNSAALFPAEDPATGIYLGPFIGGLRRHLGRTAIVRGMSMDTLSHLNGLRRFLTGHEPQGDNAKGSSIATHFSAELGANDPLPNLVFNTETYNRDRDSWASGIRMAAVPELVRLLSPGGMEFSPAEEETIDMALGQYADCRDACVSSLRGAAYRGRDDARALLTRSLADRFRFESTSPEMATLRMKYGFDLSNYASADQFEAHVAAAYTALTAKISRVVSVQLGSRFDTHGLDNWTNQGGYQVRAFNAIAAIVDDLAARNYARADGTVDKWIDHVTILVTSEFSRTPLIGAYGGRDHHLMNACLLIGADVKAGVYGASSDVGMMPQPMDLATGAVSASGTIVKPEHVLRALMHSAGVASDVADLRVEPLRAAFTSLRGVG
jgi:uncharacterized protein (DUF1501 family)